MQDKLVMLKHSLTRKQIDSRNSKEGPLSLFQLVAEKYNDKNWVVHSRIMPDLNEKFRRPIRLALMTCDEEMTEQSVKNAYTDVKGKLNFAIANWKTSGNGKGNLNPKLKGLEYDGTSLKEKESNEAITYVDDDRYRFVQQLHVAYFWSLSEITGLTQCISQNCSALNMGISDADVLKRASTSSRAVGRRASSSSEKSVSTNKKLKIEKQTDALFAMVSDIKNGFLSQTNHFKQSTLNTQILDAEEAIISL
jgi:hypothetical protein